MVNVKSWMSWKVFQMLITLMSSLQPKQLSREISDDEIRLALATPVFVLIDFNARGAILHSNAVRVPAIGMAQLKLSGSDIDKLGL